jgi:LysR family transcriptional regulator, nitrogen assimilation regulatory protein
MDLRHLRTFVAVAEDGTVSKASLRLRIAQPALSRQIHDLEEELGIGLFDRVRRRLVLTGEGEQLLHDCRAVLGAVDGLRERAQVLRQGDSGILRVAATPQTIDGVLSAFLRQYAERRPKVQIRLTEAVGADHSSMLERGRAHLAVGLIQPTQAANPFIENFLLAQLEFLAASPRSLKLGTAGDVDIGRLAAYPLLLLDTGFYVRQTFDAACRLAGVKPDIFIESRTPHVLLALAEAGHGVAVVPSVLPTHRYRLRVARITHRRKPLREAYAVLWDKRRMLPPYARDFCELLAAHVREILPVAQASAPRSNRTPKPAAPRPRR